MIRTSRLALVALTSLLLASCALLDKVVPGPAPAAARPPVPKGVWAQTQSDVVVDPAVKFGTLPNGMRYAIMKNATPSAQASLRLWFDAGSFLERDDQQGLAHFLEHMAFNGSKAVPEGEMVRILERLGLAFGADTNASTGFTETVYKLDLPRTNDETVDTSLMLLRETAGNLTINQEAVDRERGVVLSEERSRDTPSLRAFIAQTNFFMPGHIATRRLPIGKVEVLRTAPRSAIADFYDAYYRPERAVLIAVGDFDVAAMEAKITARFSDWRNPAPAGPEAVLLRPSPRGPEAKVHVEAGLPLRLDIAWMSPPDLDPDTVAERKEDLIEGLGFAILNRRLERVGRSGDAPFIASAAFSGDQFHSTEQTSLAVVAHPGRWEDAMSAAEQEQRRIVQFGVRQDELDREIDELRTTVKARADAMATRRTPGLADELVGTLEDAIVQTNPAQDLAFFEDAAKSITVRQVSAALTRAFSGSGPLVFLSSPTPIEGGDAAVLAAFNRSRARPVTETAAQAAKTWPYENFGTPGKVAEETEIEDLDTIFVRFENGVRLTVKQTKFRDDEILVTARIGDGLLSLPTDRMTAEWASSAFTEGGLDQLTAEELEDVLRSRIVGLDLGVEDQAFVLAGETRPEDLNIQMQLLTAAATHPGWRPEAFLRQRSAASTAHDQQDATANGVIGRELSGLLHSGDARWAFPTREQIAAAKPEDLRALFEPPLSTGPIEVLIIGDVAPEKAIEAVAATFGALPPRPAPSWRPGTSLTTAFPAPTPSPVILRHKGRADQAIAFMAWPTDDYYADIQKTRTVRVLRDVLDLRLIDEIREKQGTTYSPQVSSSESLIFQDYGFLSANILAEPEKLDRFFADVQKIAGDLRDAPVSDDELERAKKPAIEALEKAFESNEFWVRQLSGAQSDRRRLDAIRSARASLQRITAADVQAVAREYLRDDRLWKLLVLPEGARR